MTVAASYTKNGEQATLPLPTDVARFVALMPSNTTIFPLPHSGPKMLKIDLDAAGIDYREESGLFLDFHALRCQCATLADQAGVSPRVVQSLMRHSTLELTGRYTRPRKLDIDRASRMLPSLTQTERVFAGFPSSDWHRPATYKPETFPSPSLRRGRIGSESVGF